MTKEQVYRAALELIQHDRNENNQPARDRADLISVAVLALRHADQLPDEPPANPFHDGTPVCLNHEGFSGLTKDCPTCNAPAGAEVSHE